VVCGCLLFSILIPATLLAEHWIEDSAHRFADHMVWREPVEDSNR